MSDECMPHEVLLDAVSTLPMLTSVLVVLDSILQEA
jgi:hypothetical protein